MRWTFNQSKREYIIAELSRYWPKNKKLIWDLPIEKKDFSFEECVPPVMEWVKWPEWAHKYSIEGQVFVPHHMMFDKEKSWEKIDWFAVAFWYLNVVAEQSFERQYGPIHSYSFKLKAWDENIWKYAWVNRIALFLRLWVGKIQNKDSTELLGDIAKESIILTHDIDAVTKTFAIRFKQAIFYLFNSFKSLFNARYKLSLSNMYHFWRFLFSHDDYWCFDKILELEDKYHLRSHFNFYAGLGGWDRNIKQLFYDPAYNVFDNKLRSQIQQMVNNGWTIGLHQSINNWHNKEQMLFEKKRLEQALGKEVFSCRQHWLRFSWQKTWVAQEEAGFHLDTTLGFNDRSGFRNSACLEYHPWNFENDRPMTIKVIPMILMDSQLYNYHNYSDDDRIQEMHKWISEVKNVFGIATVLWHQRVMSDDYGWGDGYKNLIRLVIA